MNKLIQFCMHAMLAFALGACGGSAGNADSSAQSDSGFPQDDPSRANATLGCSWLFVSNPDLANVAFPDEFATYWVASFPALPGTRLRVEGQYPKARYFSYNVYDPALRPVDAVTDFALVPRIAGTNPYRSTGAGPGGEYVAYIKPVPKPDAPETNTLYSGNIGLPGGQALPFNPTISLIYRIYLAETDQQGGVALPVLTLESADGTQAPITFHMSPCQPLPPDGLPSILNEAVRESSLPPEAGFLPFPPARQEPSVVRFYGLPETARVLMSNTMGREIPQNPATQGDGGGFLSNVDNAYLTTMASRDKGSLYIMRALAPSYARVPTDAPLGSAQLRYWSICTNEFFTQRFVGCLHDAQVPLDEQGYFTIVVSDPDQRPSNAIAENGVAWLPWGAIYYDSVLIYRHMLPSAHFAEAIQNIPYGTPVHEVMGEYGPLLVYCDKATVESAGNSPAAIFSACSD